MSAATPSRQRAHTGNGVVARAAPRRRPWLMRWVNSLPGSAAGLVEVARSATADVMGVIDPRHHPAGDPLELRDPDYIRRTLPGLRAMSEFYFRAEVRGLDNVPAGPVLLVGNHSGGWLIADTFVFSQAFYDHFGPERMFHQLTHDLVFKIPGLRAIITPFGAVPACPENMRRALARGATVLVYPGGDHETYRASWHEAEIDFAHRTGFARLALELGIPIVPVVAIGGQETALFLGQGERIARLLHLHELLRIDVAPVQVGPPVGLTVLDLPVRVPLPSKITIEVLPPIHLAEELGPDADAEHAYDLVTGRMQQALDRLAAARRYPLIG
ncbi:lysophospholipid acyltransferase family protein [Baekduia soli]|nr:lysophospholipid acyltransferase family protein [Baekduia soli]